MHSFDHTLQYKVGDEEIVRIFANPTNIDTVASSVDLD